MKKITILLKDAGAVKYWGEKLISICEENNITNIWNFNSSDEDSDMWEDRYYIKNKTVYLDEDYDEDYENIMLEEIKK